MARPIHADAEATRRRVLDAASNLFSAKGLASTTMREIASKAGVSMATVHHYYGGKNDLYEACVAAMYEELETLRAEIEAAVFGSTDLSEVVDAAVRRTYHFSRRHRDAVRLMNRTVLATGQLDEKRRRDFLQPFLDNGGRVIGALLGKPPEQTRLALLAMNYLIARFVLNSDSELKLVTGVPPDAPAEHAIQRVEDYLVSAAFDLFGLPKSNTSTPANAPS